MTSLFWGRGRWNPMALVTNLRSLYWRKQFYFQSILAVMITEANYTSCSAQWGMVASCCKVFGQDLKEEGFERYASQRFSARVPQLSYWVGVLIRALTQAFVHHLNLFFRQATFLPSVYQTFGLNEWARGYQSLHTFTFQPCPLITLQQCFRSL